MIARSHWSLAVPCLGAMALSMCSTAPSAPPESDNASSTERSSSALAQGPSALFIGGAEEGSRLLLAQGKHIFRFDTFGDEAFWSDKLQLQRAVDALSPQDALGLGLKVDAQALTAAQRRAIETGTIDLDDPAVTRQLVKQNAVLGIVGSFATDGALTSVGLSCAICHSTVNDSVAPGIGSRIDGLANRDLNVGGIIAAAPNLQPLADALSVAGTTVDVATVRVVLNSWGPGKFDAELFLDGKACVSGVSSCPRMTRGAFTTMGVLPRSSTS